MKENVSGCFFSEHSVLMTHVFDFITRIAALARNQPKY